MAGLTYQEAKDRLTSMVSAAEEPILVDSDLEDLMRLARVTDRYGTSPDAFSIWRAGKDYVETDTVVPTSRGDMGPMSWSSYLYLPPPLPFTAAIVWEAEGDGTSGDTEPVWPAPVVLGTTTVVDNTITWKAMAVTPWYGNWDLALAACEGWRRKAGKASSGYQFTDQGKSLNRNQIFEQCLKMSQQYAKKAMRSQSLSKGDPYRTGRLIPGVETNWDYWE
jgi:hypothetical protein